MAASSSVSNEKMQCIVVYLVPYPVLMSLASPQSHNFQDVHAAS